MRPEVNSCLNAVLPECLHVYVPYCLTALLPKCLVAWIIRRAFLISIPVDPRDPADLRSQDVV